MLAWLINFYIDRVARVRDEITALLNAGSLAQQQSIYRQGLSEAFWSRFLRWVMDRDATLSLLGVPRPQRQQVDRTYPGGIVQFIEDRLEAVFTRLPMHDNYFWRVYLNGSYSRECCPEYLKADNFARLKEGLVDCVSVHTSSILDFLEGNPGQISRFVLLDHMDWLSTFRQRILDRQWQGIVDRAAPRSRLLWRSGGMRVDYVDPIEVTVAGRRRRVGELLTYDHNLAAELHPRDRVHTYGSFYIADLALA
jgi:S-adenosylmethionine-diacylglycerol 3-amino-3-carboxypropyl transferase